jgi:hypothetical protein
MKYVLVSSGAQELETKLQALCDDPDTQFVLMMMAAQSSVPLETVEKLLMNSSKPVFGGIFPYVLFDKSLMSTAIVLISFSVRYQMAIIQDLTNREQVEHELQRQLPWQNMERGTLFVFVHGISDGVQRLIDGMFNQYGLETNYIGGGCGTLQNWRLPCVITPHGILSDAAILVLADVPSGIGVSHGWQSVSHAFKVTEVKDNEIISINWRPALEVYRSVVEDHAGIRFSELPFSEIARAYPFGIAKLADELVIRDAIDVNGTNIVCVGNVRCGSYVHIMHGKPDYVSAAASKAKRRALESLKGREPELMLFMDCISRVLFLGELFAREITHVSMENIPLTGALTLGEIANNGYDYLELYNKTCVVGLLTSDKTRVH